MIGLHSGLIHWRGIFLPKYISIICCWKALRIKSFFLQLVSINIRYFESSFHGKDARNFLVGERGHLAFGNADLDLFPLLYILNSSHL